MVEQQSGATPQWYFLAHLKTYERDWFSLHLSEEDAERQLQAVAAAWDDVWFTLDDEPVGVLFYGVEEVPLLGPEESGLPPDEPILITLTREENATAKWLAERRDVAGGMSANDLAEDLGITVEVATLRLVGLTGLDLAHEVGPDRFRIGPEESPRDQ